MRTCFGPKPPVKKEKKVTLSKITEIEKTLLALKKVQFWRGGPAYARCSPTILHKSQTKDSSVVSGPFRIAGQTAQANTRAHIPHPHRRVKARTDYLPSADV
jgi:hypothetical protein